MECECKRSGVNIKAFRGDNGIYKAAEFRAELRKNNQHITYCGVGAYHQNGITERYIRTMVDKTRTVLLNAHARWPTSIKMEVWTFYSSILWYQTALQIFLVRRVFWISSISSLFFARKDH